jgi:hypothetical protein
VFFSLEAKSMYHGVAIVGKRFSKILRSIDSTQVAVKAAACRPRVAKAVSGCHAFFTAGHHNRRALRAAGLLPATRPRLPRVGQRRTRRLGIDLDGNDVLTVSLSTAATTRTDLNNCAIELYDAAVAGPVLALDTAGMPEPAHDVRARHA